MPDIKDVSQDAALSLTAGGVGSTISSIGGFGDLVLGNTKPNPLTVFGSDLRRRVRRDWASDYRRQRSAAYDDLEKRRGSLDAMGVYPSEGTYRGLENIVPSFLVAGVFSKVLSPGVGFLAATSLFESGLQGGQAYGEQIREGNSRTEGYNEALRQGTVSLAANLVTGAGGMGISTLRRKIPYSFSTEWAEGVLNSRFQVPENKTVLYQNTPNTQSLPDRQELDKEYAENAQRIKDNNSDYICDENGCIHKDVYKRMRGVK